MKRKISLFFIISFWGISIVYGQTALEKAIKVMNMSIQMPSYFDASKNEDLIYVTPITEESPIPKLAQTYYFEPVFGSTAFKVFFGQIHSIIRHTSGEYLIFVSAAGEFVVKYGFLIEEKSDLFNVRDLTFNGIKSNFRYGKRMESASKEEIEELDLMLTHYSEKQAKKMFNADRMVTYPMNLRGEIYEEKYPRCRALVVSKKGLDIFFYFLMTNESAKKFDEYLEDLNKVFWFNE
jgi:hypothetical protein